MGAVVCITVVALVIYRIKPNKDSTPGNVDTTAAQESGTVEIIYDRGETYRLEYGGPGDSKIVKGNGEVYRGNIEVTDTGFIDNEVTIESIKSMGDSSNYDYLSNYKTGIDKVYSLDKLGYLKYIAQLINTGQEIVFMDQTSSYIDVYLYDKTTDKATRLLNSGQESIVGNVESSKIPKVDSYFN